MAIGKNKRLGKKKGGKKKTADPFLSKEWYDVQAPVMFKRRNVGKSMVNPTRGQRIASDFLRGRVFEINLADLQGEEDNSYRKMKLKVDEVHGRKLLTNFYGMDFTRDKLCGLIRKWHTLIEAFVDVKTTDGYVLRMFCIGFTKRRPNQVCNTSYAQSAQIRAIRKKMTQTMVKGAESCDLKALVDKFVAETISKDVQKAASAIYPLENVFIRKVKTLKQPRFDLTKLMEVHEGGSADSGAVVTEVQVETLTGAGGRL